MGEENNSVGSPLVPHLEIPPLTSPCSPSLSPSMGYPRIPHFGVSPCPHLRGLPLFSSMGTPLSPHFGVPPCPQSMETPLVPLCEAGEGTKQGQRRSPGLPVPPWGAAPCPDTPGEWGRRRGGAAPVQPRSPTASASRFRRCDRFRRSLLSRSAPPRPSPVRRGEKARGRRGGRGGERPGWAGVSVRGRPQGRGLLQGRPQGRGLGLR